VKCLFRLVDSSGEIPQPPVSEDRLWVGPARRARLGASGGARGRRHALALAPVPCARVQPSQELHADRRDVVSDGSAKEAALLSMATRKPPCYLYCVRVLQRARSRECSVVTSLPIRLKQGATDRKEERMARIGLLLTRTPWKDRRQYHRQGPALLAAGHTVVYLAGVPEIDLDYPYEAVPLSAGERKAAGLTGGLNLLRKIARARLDALQICSVELLPLGIAAKLLRLTKVVYDCREDMHSAMRDHKTRFPKPVRIGLALMTRLLEAAGDRLFDGLVTADPATADLHRHMAQDRKVVFYNVAPTRHFPIDGPSLVEREYDVAIVGTMSHRTGVLDIIRAVALLRDRGMRLKVLAVGWPASPVTESMIKELMDELCLAEQFDWRGRVDHLEIPNLLYNTRIGIVPLHGYMKFQHNIACKALEFIAARMVTVATDLPPQRLFLVHQHNAVIYQPGNVTELADALSSLLGDLENAQRIADQARRDFLTRWNLENIRTSYIDLYDRLTSESERVLVERAR
jgi:glycosyltransferase involved in cell wall biosynthesis